MKLGSVIVSVAEPLLKNYGFVYTGKQDHLSWTFTKKTITNEQIIVFDKSSLDSSLRVILETTQFFYNRPVYIHHLIPNSLIPPRGFWKYHDEISLKAVVQHLSELAINYGIECLNGMSIPLVNPDDTIYEQQKEMDHNHAGSKFAQEYNLDMSDEFSIIQLEELIKEKKATNSMFDWNFILNAASFFGEFIINKKGGKWSWDEANKKMIIGDLIPLKSITNFYSNDLLFYLKLTHQYKNHY